MFGKLKILTFLSFSLLLSACNANNTGNINNKNENMILEDNKENYLKISETGESNSLKDINIEDKFANAQYISYPGVYEIIPQILNNNQLLIAQANNPKNAGEIHLASYDLKNNKFELKKILDNSNSNKSLISLAADSTNIVFEEYDRQALLAKFFIMDVNSGQYREIISKENVPPIHISQVIIHNNKIILSIYDAPSQKYILSSYSIANLEKKDLELENSGYPVVYKDELYYLLIDNNQKTTSLIKYNEKNNKKLVLYKTEGENNYISALLSDNKNLILITNSENLFKVYKLLDDKELKYIFSNSWIESPVYKSGYLSWIGDSTIEDRVRMQYYLVNLDKMENYVNKGGNIFLSDSNILWIKYNVEEKDILKGRTMTPEYSRMMLDNLN